MERNEQAGNGISRRHIKGSEIAKGLQCVKYSFTVPKQPRSWIELARPFGFSNIHYVAKIPKN